MYPWEGVVGRGIGMMGMGTAGVGMDTDMTTTEAVGIMKDDKRYCFQSRGVVSITIFKRNLSMKRYSQVIGLLGLAFITIIGAGAFSAASADGYYYGHGDHRYRRAYDYCASRYHVGNHRFDRCMDYHLNEYRHW